MANTSLADSRQPSTDPPGYLVRGRLLYEEHGASIKHLRGDTWLCPSGSEVAIVYEVRIGRAESCECIGFGYRGYCSHVVAVTIANAKSDECAYCYRRAPGRYCYVVGAESLTFYEGDVLCRKCAIVHGVL